MFGASEELRVEHLQNNAMEFVYAASSIVAQPVEILIRPWYGTRYYEIPILFFSAGMMMLLPAIKSLFTNVMQMIPFLQVPHPVGMFGLDDYARLYFLASAVQGVRLWRRVIHPSRERHSRFEGPALPFFAFLPKGTEFFWTRLLWEPTFVLLASVVLQDLFIAQPSLAIYLRIAAFALFMKNFVVWFRSYEVIRDGLDAGAGGEAFNEQLASVRKEKGAEQFYVAGRARNLNPTVRGAFAQQIARTDSTANSNAQIQQKENTNETAH
jgi:hypothetical protein